MRLRIAHLLLFLWCTTACAQTTRPARPEPRINRVLIISIDGGRPDVLLRANMPNLRRLCDNGAFTFWARTVPVSITLPSHVSMFTGVAPELHGINFNTDQEPSQLTYPNVPTLFQLAKRAGYSTGMCAGKSKFAVLDVPGSIDFKSLPSTTKCEDPDVADQATAMIRKHKPEVMLVHFASCDNTGHADGWGSPEQINTAAVADVALGRVLDALRDANVFDSTMIIVTADHGGAGKTHGAGDARSRTIPWIVCGPGIQKNYDLSQMGKEVDINTYDTFATACAVLGIAVEGKIDGRFVAEIFARRELLETTPK